MITYFSFRNLNNYNIATTKLVNIKIVITISHDYFLSIVPITNKIFIIMVRQLRSIPVYFNCTRTEDFPKKKTNYKYMQILYLQITNINVIFHLWILLQIGSISSKYAIRIGMIQVISQLQYLHCFSNELLRLSVLSLVHIDIQLYHDQCYFHRVW